MYHLLEQFDHHDLELIQYYELKFLKEFLLMVKYYQYLMVNQNQQELYYQHLNFSDVKYIVFHHLHNELMQF
jgi:hypothetical protein